MSLATLVVALEANVAKFTTDMNSAARVVEQTGKTIESMAERAGRALDRIGSIIAVEGLRRLVENTIEASDKLRDLAAYTGSTVEALSRLKQPADLARISMDQVGEMIAKFSKNLADAQNPTSMAAKAFNAIGLSAADVSRLLKKDAVAALIDVAKQLEGFRGSAAKAGVEAMLLGRGSAQTAQFLANLTEDMGAATTATREQTDAAHAARVAQAELHATIEGLVNSGVAALAPMITDVAKAFNGLAADKNSTVGFFETIGVGMKIAAAAAGVLWIALKDVGQTIAAIAAMGQARMQAGGDSSLLGSLFTQAGAVYRGLRGGGGLAGVQSELGKVGAGTQMQAITQAWREDLAGNQTALVNFMATLTGLDAAHKKAGDAAQGHGKDVGDLTANVIKANDAAVSWINRMLEEITAAEDGATAVLYQKAATAGLTAAIAGPYISALQAAKAAEADRNASIKAAAELVKIQEDALAAAINGQSKYIESVMDSTKEIKLQTDTLGMSDVEMKIFATNLELEAKKQADLAESTTTTRQAVEALTAKMAALQALANKSALLDAANEAKRAWQETARSIQSGLEEAFMNGLKHSKSLFDTFKSAIENLFRTLILRPILAPISGALATAYAPFASAQPFGAAGTAASGFNAFSGFSSAVSVFSNSASALSMGFTDFTQLLGQGLGFGQAASTAIAGMGGVGSLLSAALPWAGLAAIVVPLVAKLFDDGPAERRGNFASGPGAAYNPDFTGTSAFGQFGIAADQWFSKSEMGSALSGLITNVTTLDNAISRIVGGNKTSAIAAALAGSSRNYGFGTEHTDLNATGVIGAILKDRYGAVFEVIDKRLGDLVRSFSGTGEELATFAVSLANLSTILPKVSTQIGDKLVAQVQNFTGTGSELSQFVASLGGLATMLPKLSDAIQNGLIGALDGTVDSVNRIVVFAQSLVAIGDLLKRNPWSDAATLTDTGAYDVFVRAGNAVQDLIKNFDGSATAAANLAAATGDLYGAQVQLLGEIKTVRNEILGGPHGAGLINDTIRTARLQTMTPAQQGDFLNQESRWAQGLLSTAMDPADIQRYAQLIVSDAQASFNMLDTWSQQRNFPVLESFLTQIGTLVDNRLTEVGNNVTNPVQDTLTTASNVMSDAATKFGDAATAIGTAAATMSSAAATMSNAADDIASGGNDILKAASQPIVVDLHGMSGNELVPA